MDGERRQVWALADCGHHYPEFECDWRCNPGNFEPAPFCGDPKCDLVDQIGPHTHIGWTEEK